MTARIRRWTRCGKSNHVSDRLAAVWCDGSKNLGTITDDLLGEDRFREVVALAIFLILSSGSHFQSTFIGVFISIAGEGQDRPEKRCPAKVDIIYLIRRYIRDEAGARDNDEGGIT